MLIWFPLKICMQEYVPNLLRLHCTTVMHLDDSILPLQNEQKAVTHQKGFT